MTIVQDSNSTKRDVTVSREELFKLLTAIAPEIDSGILDDNLPLRSQVELDSMDYLSFIVAIHKEFGVNIPETDYSKVQSINSLIQYIDGALRVS